MVDTQDRTSVIALCIALLALVVASGQLLSQIFTTADGYRRCQSSVIGQWSRLTHLKWRWSEFRFETKFSTPTFNILPVPWQAADVDKLPFIIATRDQAAPGGTSVGKRLQSKASMLRGSSLRTRLFLTGDRQSLAHSFVRLRDEQDSFDGPSDHELGTDSAGWLKMLTSLQACQLKSLIDPKNIQQVLFPTTAYLQERDEDSYRRLVFSLETPAYQLYRSTTALPAISIVERSWDFIPPGITRPLAQTNVGSLIVLAHRLGMQWRDIDPAEGKLRAEGNGHSITSSIVRGYGTIVQYSYDRSLAGPMIEGKRPDSITSTIPTVEADKMLCGIIPGCRLLGIDDLPAASLNEDSELFHQALASFGIDEGVRNQLIHAHSSEESVIWEIFGMVCPFMPVATSTNVHIVHPCRATRYGTTLRWREGRVVHRYRLAKYLEQHPTESSEALTRVLEHLDALFKNWYRAMQYYDGENILTDDGSWERKYLFLSTLFKIFKTASESLRDFWTDGNEHHEQGQERNWYALLIGAYFTANVDSSKAAKESEAPREPADIVHGPKSSWMMERTHIHVDRVDLVISLMKQEGYSDASRVRDAFWWMVLRAICWELSVVFVQDDQQRTVPLSKVPAQFYYSQTPVYIT